MTTISATVSNELVILLVRSQGSGLHHLQSVFPFKATLEHVEKLL